MIEVSETAVAHAEVGAQIFLIFVILKKSADQAAQHLNWK